MNTVSQQLRNLLFSIYIYGNNQILVGHHAKHAIKFVIRLFVLYVLPDPYILGDPQLLS